MSIVKIMVRSFTGDDKNVDLLPVESLGYALKCSWTRDSTLF